ncbi:alpha/beta hydrolase [Pseudanabaena galeata UHCC 0370]|uniref:Alpha/beta hydrolase n=1 Tax=Pseudanabaena galeata UHCC 0370 TaxID=3110310 RepID=A0ABU5TIS1_9CYAN|nr:alpha/beta hydrolase [Pseudanabaena galeata]MEA5478225.1 alpha/beta hydrolase [Pseudanabaena galeata UHCC 0370]
MVLSQYLHRIFMFRNRVFLAIAVVLAIALGSAIFKPSPAISAEKISFWYPPFGQFTIPIPDLETFAKSGKITKRLAFYLDHLSPSQQVELRQALNTRYDISPIAVSQFTYSPIGLVLMKRLGRILQGDGYQNGLSALRAAIILSAASPEGLTPINVLRRFPLPTIELDLNLGLAAYSEISLLWYRKEMAIAALQKQSEHEIKNTKIPVPTDEMDSQGAYSWLKREFAFQNPEREMTINATLYNPQGATKPAPVIVISHGFASNRDTFIYLSQHLASHGYAVAVLEHPETGSKDFAAFLKGFGKTPNPRDHYLRPRDLKYLLDDLERQSQTLPDLRDRLDLQNVGLIGHSLGGYTVLALGGARLNFASIKASCDIPEPDVNSFNLSKLIQCQAINLQPQDVDLQDPRVKAIFTLNPIGGSTMFNREGMRSLNVPVMIFASGDDMIAPTVTEQLFPFTWINGAEKYLAIVPKGTHFSFLEKSDRGVLTIPSSLIGVDPSFAHPYVKSLSIAFFKTYLARQSTFQAYLTANYAKTISRDPLPLNLVTSFSEQQLVEALSIQP